MLLQLPSWGNFFIEMKPEKEIQRAGLSIAHPFKNDKSYSCFDMLCPFLLYFALENLKELGVSGRITTKALNKLEKSPAICEIISKNFTFPLRLYAMCFLHPSGATDEDSKL
ncbi:hypothetical protein ABEB36_010335 [Hypothenemus hampei]|uniref:Uncharacterized protein n=1 Tax=Hypothenemus hampei TaxID=57062 RepID=A0ABD1EJB8_HYPHA